MKKIRLLIVDEHSVVRRALGTRLSALPHIEVLAVARNFEEGLAFNRSLQPDVILLEPKVSGEYEASSVEQLTRQFTNGHPVGVIVLTSFMDEVERDAALQAGARRYLLKEIDSERLIAEIEAVAQELETTGARSLGKEFAINMKRNLVKNWMTRKVVTITPDTTLPEAHKLMSEKRIRRLPVVENGRLVGIVTRGDVRGAEPSGATSLSIWEINYLLSRLKVEELMTSTPITVREDATIGEAAELMLKHKISGLPVINGEEHVVGIITESDIFRMVVDEWREA